MKKNVWIINHYATSMYKSHSGRHFWFAENLIEQGYLVTLFCASTLHNSKEKINTGNRKYKIDFAHKIPFVFIRTSCYTGNGINRVINIIIFYINLFTVAKEYELENGRPDVILASSVHPLALVAGIQIAKKLHIPCVCEIRDLWPESLKVLGVVRNDLILNLLYKIEKWIYQRANKLIFTMEGGKNYLIEKKWNKDKRGSIDLKKVFYINNGIDLNLFYYNKDKYLIKDYDIENTETFKVIYTGSIRKANNVQVLIEAALIIQKRNHSKIKIIIYGDGDQCSILKQYIRINQISNVVLKNKVDRKYIPYVLSRADLAVENLDSDNMSRKYGTSANKLFDYLASGTPVLALESNFSIVKKFNCGVSLSIMDPIHIANAIIDYYFLTDASQKTSLSKNCIIASKEFDFKKLTQQLIHVIEN